MSATETIESGAGGRTARGVDVGDARLYAETRGTGPDVLLLGGLGDTVEAWTAQLEGLSDRYRLHALDNRGAGRSPMPPDGFTFAGMADDAAAVLRASGVSSAHVAGFSGGAAIAQEIALRHPDVVRSLLLVSTWGRWDDYARTMLRSWRWLPDCAPDDRAMLEAFFLWVYTPRAHADGTVAAIVDEALAFPHPQSAEAFQRQVDMVAAHDALDRLPAISAPTLVVAGGLDRITPPRFGREVAERIPGARFVLLPEEAHQPFQEVPDQFNALADEFWRSVDAG
jgi:pimeloyl-ACP methyl ester carboxylesterase